MLSGVGGLLMYGAFLGGKLLEVMRSNFSLRREEVMDERFMGTFLLASGKAALIGMLPMIALVVIAAIVGHIALGGFLFSGKMLAPKPSRMNPMSGIARMFSQEFPGGVAQGLGKFFIILGVSVLVLMSERTALLQIAKLPTEQALLHSMQVVGMPPCCWPGAADHRRGGRALPDLQQPQEADDDQAGDQGRIQGRRGQARGQGQDPPDAAADGPASDDGRGAQCRCGHHQPDPLRRGAQVRRGKGGAPVLVAKGSDFTALKIREIARNTSLAAGIARAGGARCISPPRWIRRFGRTLCAVAQVLAYVYQLRQFRAGRGRKPKLSDLPIPPDLRRDEEGKAPT